MAWISRDLDDLRHCLKISQSTGLTDKNGKEIFEGDIIRMSYEKDSVNPPRHWVGVVEFGDHQTSGDYYASSAYGWYVKQSFEEQSIAQLSGDRHEVIGNIYENPELLK